MYEPTGQGREGANTSHASIFSDPILCHTRRLVLPWHTEPSLVLLEGLKAWSTGMCPWWAFCPPLQSTIQASRTGGSI